MPADAGKDGGCLDAVGFEAGDDEAAISARACAALGDGVAHEGDFFAALDEDFVSTNGGGREEPEGERADGKEECGKVTGKHGECEHEISCGKISGKWRAA